MREGRNTSTGECFGALEDPRVERCKRHQLLDIITIALCAVICGADSWVYTWSCSARARRSGSAPPWTFSMDLPLESRPTTPLAMCSPVWTRTSSRNASWSGAKGWPSCSPERWGPSTARRCGALTTRGQASRPFIWSAPGPRPTPPYRSTGQGLTFGQAGVLAGHRPGLPGIPERRRGVARAADWGQGVGPPWDGGRNHDTGQVLHQQSGCISQKAVGSGAGPPERRELAALELGCCLPGGPEPGEEGPRGAEHGHAASNFPQPSETGSNPESRHPGQTAAGWRA